MILNSFVRAVDELGFDLEKVLSVSGIGCSAWIPSPHFNSDTLHVTHGRAIPFASGVKLFNNELTTVVFTGDGDGAGIGGNHLIHAARRNIDITTILVNNFSYAMTGGQVAPTTFLGLKTITSPFGNVERPFDLCKLMTAAGATYVARWTTYHIRELRRSIKDALKNKGFSFIEVFSQCPTQQRRLLNLRSSDRSDIPLKILEMFKESTYIRHMPREENYFYITPKSDLSLSQMKVSKILSENSIDFKIREVDRLFFGRILKVECRNIECLKKALNLVKRLAKIGRVLRSRMGKIALGVFVSKSSRELTASIREISALEKGVEV
jgi:2-oxoglutarate ferredoxin oxidoreductase subunit beta